MSCNITEKNIMRGVYTFKEYDAKTNELISTYEKKNLITGALKNAILQWLNFSEEVSPPANNFINLQYMAFGDGTTPPVEADTILENELFRKAYTNKGYVGNILEFVVSLGTADANFTIREVGVFANGSLTPDSGTMTSRTIVNVEKNDNKIINVYYRLELI